MISNLRLGWVVLLMLCLSVMPMGFPLGLFRPAWIVLLVMYLQCTAPKQCSVLFILLLGLFVDALGLGVLGQHAFALLLTAWMMLKRAQRFRLFSMSQQLIGIAAFACVYQLVLLGTQAIWGYPVHLGEGLCAVMMTVLCWPWFQYLGDSLFFAPVTPTNT